MKKEPPCDAVHGTGQFADARGLNPARDGEWPCQAAHALLGGDILYYITFFVIKKQKTVKIHMICITYIYMLVLYPVLGLPYYCPTTATGMVHPSGVCAESLGKKHCQSDLDMPRWVPNLLGSSRLLVLYPRKISTHRFLPHPDSSWI